MVIGIRLAQWVQVCCLDSLIHFLPKHLLLQVPLPSEFLGMAPYLATIIVLAGVIGRGHAPAAEGEPYEKE